MIALVAGDVAVRRADHVVMETASGVGYRLMVSAETLKQVSARSARPSLYIRTSRSATTRWCSTASRPRRSAILFMLLLGVQSVGPKVALAVLSGGSPRDLISALAAGDVTRFTAVNGIGKRTAERIVVELRDKVGDFGQGGGPAITVHRGDDPRALARDGLIELGYAPQEAQELIAAAEGETPEELLQTALQAARR